MHASANVYLGFGRVLALWDNAAGPSRNICVSWTGEDKIAHSGHYSRIADLVDDLTRTDEFVTSGTNFRLFTLEGELTRWADLHPAPPNGCSQVYFVPQGRQFQWPVEENFDEFNCQIGILIFYSIAISRSLFSSQNLNVS